MTELKTAAHRWQQIVNKTSGISKGK